MSTLRTSRRRSASLAVVATFLLGLLSAVPVAAADDVAPTVSATTPANGATGVAVNATLSVTFSEPVDVVGNWFRVACDESSNHLSAAGGGPETWTIDPVNNFVNDEACTLTLVAANITDQDADDPPDTMAEDVVIAFTVASAAPTTPDPVDPAPGGGGTVKVKKPLKALPAVNKTKAGSAIPVRFSFGGTFDRGAVTVTSAAYPCGTTPPTDATEAAKVRLHRAWKHGPKKHTYAFVWKTQKAWKNTCRVLVVDMGSGEPQTIAFRFK